LPLCSVWPWVGYFDVSKQKNKNVTARHLLSVTSAAKRKCL